MTEDTPAIRVKMITHPRDTEAGQRFVVREEAFNAVNVEEMSDSEFLTWATEEANSLGGNKLEFVD